MAPRTLLTLLTLFYTTTQAQDCYFVNGTIVPPKYQAKPCPNDPVRTICCALDRTVPPGSDLANGNPQDICLDNGICMNNFVSKGQNQTRYWLNFCTNKDVTSTDCLDVCRETRNSGGGSLMTPCDGTPNSKKWCCGGERACCTNNIGGVELPEKFIGRAVSISASSAAPAATPSSSPVDAAHHNSTSSSAPAEVASPGRTNTALPTPLPTSLSTGAKAGIGIGAAAGVLLLGLCLFFARKAMVARKESAAQAAYAAKGPYDAHYSPSMQPQSIVYAHEVSGEQPELCEAYGSMVEKKGQGDMKKNGHMAELQAEGSGPVELPGESMKQYSPLDRKVQV